MKNVSKPWDWSKNTQDFWNDPAQESYFLVNRWKKKSFVKFLDLGCGLGRHSLLFAGNGFQVDSFDLSREAIDGLRERTEEESIPNIRCTHGDMNELPFKEDCFDCLLAYHVISHTDTAGIKGIMDEIHRVLKPGGEFYLTLGSKSAWSFADAGYPKHDENTIIKREDGPENGIPHFYSDESGIDELFARFTLINVQHVQDVIANKSRLRNSWHYYILGGKP
jgi:SAM-dependent methyltransferase